MLFVFQKILPTILATLVFLTAFGFPYRIGQSVPDKGDSEGLVLVVLDEDSPKKQQDRFRSFEQDQREGESGQSFPVAQAPAPLIPAVVPIMILQQSQQEQFFPVAHQSKKGFQQNREDFENLSTNKRSIRRCGMLLIRHIQAVCKGCLKGASSDSEAITIAKRSSSSSRLKKDLTGFGFAKITDMCCTQRSCTDEEIQPLCC